MFLILPSIHIAIELLRLIARDINKKGPVSLAVYGDISHPQ